MTTLYSNNKNLFYIDLYKKSLKIRLFEQALLNLFDQGVLKGTTHTSVGQEIIAVLTLLNLNKDDYIISNHRCHAHFLSTYEKYSEFLNELLGRQNGICLGKAGSQHVHYKNFIANGILGNLLPVSAGIALSFKYYPKSNGIVHIFVGDGVFGQGVLYETLNFCSLKGLKCLFIVENNKIAQTTRIHDNLSGSLKKRFNSFDIEVNEYRSEDPFRIYKEVIEIKKRIIKESRPHAIIFDTERLAAHSKGDDSRQINEIEEINKKDPLLTLEKKIPENEINKIKLFSKEFINKLLIENNLIQK